MSAQELAGQPPKGHLPLAPTDSKLSLIFKYIQVFPFCLWKQSLPKAKQKEPQEELF